MNPYKRNDPVLFQGESFRVKSIDGNDVLIQNYEHRLRVHYLTISIDPWGF